MARGRRRAERQGDRWWREPPAWAWLLMVVAAVAIAVLTPLAAGRGRLSESGVDRLNDEGAQEQQSAAGAATPSDPTAVVPPTRVVAIGDGDTGGTTGGGAGEEGWPALLQQRIPEIRVDSVTAAGAGYVTPDPETGRTFAELVGAAPVEDAAAVIVFGSRNDGSGVADRVSSAAGAVFADIRSRAPDAQLIVIGPLWPSGTVPAGVRNNRDVISAAAGAVGATFVDPLADGWFVDQPELVTSDDGRLSEAGHALVADRIEPVVREAAAP